MSPTDAVFVLDALAAAGVDACVGGGWGVDALIGRQTRDHDDLDLYLGFADFLTADRVLRDHGFSPATDWLPTRVQYEDRRARAVDVHPLHYRPDGTAVQTLPDGTTAEFPTGDLDAAGEICGRPVRCMAPGRQRKAHEGYAPTEKDLHDLALLAGLPRG